MSSSAAGHSRRNCGLLLGCFLFSEDDVKFKKIGVLSGGERNRYALAPMLAALELPTAHDEPTNHLDMRAKDVLLEALKEYNGTVVFVSHDRYFIDNLATRVFEIQEGHVHVYPGNYEDYLWRKAGGPEAMVAEAAPPPVDETPTAVVKKDKPRVNPMKAQKMRERLTEVEQQVSSLESAIQQCEASTRRFQKRRGNSAPDGTAYRAPA